MVIMLALLIVTTYVAVVVGKIPISFDQVMTKVTTGSEQHVDAVIDLRFQGYLLHYLWGYISSIRRFITGCSAKSTRRSKYFGCFIRCVSGSQSCAFTISRVIFLRAISKFYWWCYTIYGVVCAYCEI